MDERAGATDERGGLRPGESFRTGDDAAAQALRARRRVTQSVLFVRIGRGSSAGGKALSIVHGVARPSLRCEYAVMMTTNLRTNILGIASAILVAAMCYGCASSPAAPPPFSTDKLLAAGFKLVDARTQIQQERLATLPQGRVSQIQFTGKSYFVYPDVAKNQLYIGTQKEYDAYRVLVPSTGATSLAQQHAADMAYYNKVDDRMRINTNNDLTDPWSLWGDVEGLGGR